MNNKSLLAVVVIMLIGIFAVLSIQAGTNAPSLLSGLENVNDFGSGSAAIDKPVQSN